MNLHFLAGFACFFHCRVSHGFMQMKQLRFCCSAILSDVQRRNYFTIRLGDYSTIFTEPEVNAHC